MKLTIITEPDVVVAQVSGEFSLPEAKRVFLELLDTTEKNGLQKILFDGREITTAPTDMERFGYAEYAAKSVAVFMQRNRGVSLKFAYVLLPPVLDPKKFGETVALNRGMLVKSFDNLDDACQWLGLTA